MLGNVLGSQPVLGDASWVHIAGHVNGVFRLLVHLLVLVVLQVGVLGPYLEGVGDLSVLAGDGRRQHDGLVPDDHSLAQGDDLLLAVREGHADVEAHVSLDQLLIGLVDQQDVLLDAIPNLQIVFE